MEDLVLRIRIEVLKQNLGQVAGVVGSVQERRRELRELIDLLRGSEQNSSLAEEAVEETFGAIRLAEKVRDAIGASISPVQRLGQTNDNRWNVEPLLKDLQSAEERINGVLRKLDAVERIVMTMLARSVPLREDDLASTLNAAWGRRVLIGMRRLEEIQNKRKQAEEAEHRGELATAEQLLQEAWKKYRDDIYEDSQRIFEDYIDFLGGLALRDANVDLGVCQIADKLISRWVMITDTKWKSLTIPARREGLEMSLARIIRLGFPEWTIWALPLTAHGLGHVVIGQSNDLEQYIKNQPQDELHKIHLHNYLADAFATYAMGPAYVFAAILLRFDPSWAYEDDTDNKQPAVAKRVHVLFTMLKQMNKNSGRNVYASVIDRLEKEWKAALQQVKSDGMLEDQVKKQLEQWVDDLWTYVEGNIGGLYSWESWLQIEDWPERLLRNKVEDIDLNNLADLRDVLNAAWRCRIDHPDKTNAIAPAATALWERIDERDRGRRQRSEISTSAASIMGMRSSMR